MINCRGKTVYTEIHELIYLTWNKEELPGWWNESVILPIYLKGDKTDCSNFRGTSPLFTTYKILSNIILSRLTCRGNYSDHQCGF